MNAEKILEAIKASEKFQEIMQNIVPTFEFGIKSFIESSENPNIKASKDKSLHILNGALIVHLFSIWDTYFEKIDIQKYFRPDEQKRYYAFKHIRIVSAHNIDGDRESNKADKERMDHAEKLDEINASENPIKNIILEHMKMDLSKSEVVLDCRQFMQDMAYKLACGRISVGGAYGKIRVAGGGETEVM